MDVAFSASKVVMVGNALKVGPGTDVRDVSGYIVTPGLIDLHTHVYWGGTFGTYLWSAGSSRVQSK
jgi:dihydroorotase